MENNFRTPDLDPPGNKRTSSTEGGFYNIEPREQAVNRQKRLQEDWVEQPAPQRVRSMPPDDQPVGRATHHKKSREKATANKKSHVLGWVLSIAIAVAVALCIRAFVFEIILVDGVSMQPTLFTNERVAVEKVSRYFSMPTRGDIVIVNYPNLEGNYVKRVIGLPGDTIEVKDSTVYRNGEALSEPYINSAEPFADMSGITVPEDFFFVMGDNRAHSLDSRAPYIGPISKDALVGHAMFVIWPLDQIHSIA